MGHRKRFFVKVAVLGASLAIASSASADTTSGCTVTSINYIPDSLRVTCTLSGTPGLYRAFSPNLPAINQCPRQTFDTIKIWISMVQSALLSGRPIDIQFTPTTPTCSGSVITSITQL